MKRIGAISLAAAMGIAISAKAQTLTNGTQPATISETACVVTTPAEQRALIAAKNEARQLAERINGGLNVYRSEPAMHGAVENTPCEQVSSGVWRFTFRGGEPVAVSTLEEYEVLSVVTVDNVTGSERSVSLEYNGPIEDYESSPPITPRIQSRELSLTNTAESSNALENRCIATTPAEQRALNAAKNTARRAAERANGGLNVYRSEPSMHGDVVNAPCEAVSPEVWRFTIRGGDPEAVSIQGLYTILSIVKVDGVGSERTFTLEFNGPIEDYTGSLPD